jgi:hypothetical protein
VLGWGTIAVEVIGGLMILAGALVPLAAIPMAFVLPVAIFTVHLPNGFSSIKLLSFDSAGAHFGQPGYETTCSTCRTGRALPGWCAHYDDRDHPLRSMATTCNLTTRPATIAIRLVITWTIVNVAKLDAALA